ncbi:hypothetical protein K450DRAFT_216753 [Umbelopsis ramanniana AG]|uniref:Uncharacterized protein n=1 Tax=Umbelopsis ramanniana AG TaxID=1314678 RepID=A0AAD5EJW6_UMBRA|nr:uncharacterized protein K450DRAFT_216753 [Umbelopsis ramanniana AG]KAI8584525.1 hypothetical protein K450DRAFT_216753 [Umbelopsis ramanniana AG]
MVGYGRAVYSCDSGFLLPCFIQIASQSCVMEPLISFENKVEMKELSNLDINRCCNTQNHGSTLFSSTTPFAPLA